MAFTKPAPHIVESDRGYRVETNTYPFALYVEGDRSALIEYEYLSSGNQFLGITGDAIVRAVLYPKTIRMESSGAPFAANEHVRLVRRIMAAWEWVGVRVKVAAEDKQQDLAVFYPSED